MPAKKLVVSRYLQYVLLAVGVVVLVAFVRQIGGVLLTFLAAGILAYALNPLVRRLEGWRVPRSLAVVGVFLVLAVAVVAALLVVIIPAVGQVQNIVENPQAVARQADRLVNRTQDLPYVGRRIAELDQDQVIRFLRSNAPSAGQVLRTTTGFIGGVFGVFGTILNLFLLVIISAYLLLDRERITRAALGAIPQTVRDQAVELFYAVEGALLRYLKGQLLLCAIMGAIGWAIAFFVIKDYSLLIGLWVGFTEIIPVLGAFLGAIPAVVLALFTGGVWEAVVVAGLFLVAQQLEGNILVPRIMGGSVGVHPLWVLFATLAATALYGIIGALFAVPVVAIVAATFRYLRGTLLFERWKEAPIRPASQESEPRSASPSVAARLGPTGAPDKGSGV